MNRLASNTLQIILLLLCFILFSNCRKEEKEKPLELRRHLLGDWFAHVVTQSGIDVTANYRYAFTFKPDSTTTGQRNVGGSPTQYTGTWRVDEEVDILHAKYFSWDLNWQLVQADTVADIIQFKDLDATAETIIELWRF